MEPTSDEVIIIGAGAAGLMCALEAAKRGRRVRILERNREIGKKILISGGGRANFTNRTVEAKHYLSHNPHFVKSALSRFSPSDFTARLDAAGIPYHEKKLGQLFCDGSAKQIVRLLESECRLAGVTIMIDCGDIEVSKREEFEITVLGRVLTAQSLVIATGGLSVPRLGATPFGYRLAQAFGLRVFPPSPGLVPLAFAPEDLGTFSELSGVAVDALVSCGEQSFRENILFTHRGLSGPAILQISNYWREGEVIEIDLLPDRALGDLLKKWRGEGSNKTLKTHLSTLLPRRLVERLIEASLETKGLANISDRECEKIADRVHRWRIWPASREGYAVAEVTLGGVDTDEISSKTFEAKKVPGLYFIGEVLDVAGWLGGYNLHFAWASGYCASQFV